MKNKDKNCYSCVYKDSIPGDAHIQCRFGWSKSKNNPPNGDPHGIKKGWFIFPFNFDPAWMIEECPEHSIEKDESKINRIDPLSQLISLLGKRM